MRLGERVQLLYCPDHHGTITRIYKNGDFRVSYDSHERRKDEPRAKVDYSKSHADLFIREGAIEEVQDETTVESNLLDILLNRYGIGTS